MRLSKMTRKTVAVKTEGRRDWWLNGGGRGGGMGTGETRTDGKDGSLCLCLVVFTDLLIDCGRSISPLFS